MRQSRSDDFDWTARRGRPPTIGTGPTTDHTTGNGKSKIRLNISILIFFVSALMILNII